mmetsp:Transcript_44336/g.103652  ORF Transcript_44336/g.103652 Transcript_44336/m.103652 type:complete len:260 (+) Transcript_44336:467-1246(+)
MRGLLGEHGFQDLSCAAWQALLGRRLDKQCSVSLFFATPFSCPEHELATRAGLASRELQQGCWSSFARHGDASVDGTTRDLLRLAPRHARRACVHRERCVSCRARRAIVGAAQVSGSVSITCCNLARAFESPVGIGAVSSPASRLSLRRPGSTSALRFFAVSFPSCSAAACIARASSSMAASVCMSSAKSTTSEKCAAYVWAAGSESARAPTSNSGSRLSSALSVRSACRLLPKLSAQSGRNACSKGVPRACSKACGEP